MEHLSGGKKTLWVPSQIGHVLYYSRPSQATKLDLGTSLDKLPTPV